jgi:hypothetical protein
VDAAPQGQGRYLAKALADAGIYPDQIAYQEESLEEVFLRLTGSTDGEVR